MTQEGRRWLAVLVCALVGAGGAQALAATGPSPDPAPSAAKPAKTHRATSPPPAPAPTPQPTPPPPPPQPTPPPPPPPPPPPATTAPNATAKPKATTRPKRTVKKPVARPKPKPSVVRHQQPVIQPVAPAPTVVDPGPLPTTTVAPVSKKGSSFPWVVLLLIPLALVGVLLLMGLRRGPSAAERKRLREQRKMMRKGRSSPRSKQTPETGPAEPDPDATFARSYVEWLDDH